MTAQSRSDSHRFDFAISEVSLLLYLVFLSSTSRYALRRLSLFHDGVAMKSFSLMAAVLALGLTLSVPDAEAAKRLGGGTSSGMQRSMTTPDRSSPAAAPAQAPTASATAKSPAAAANAPQA